MKKYDPPVPQGLKEDHLPAPPGMHIVPLSVYLGIFGTLMVLTGVTVFVAFQDLGVFNNLVALSIAIFKATLVLLYFMHLRYGPAMNRVLVVVAGLFLVIMMTVTLSDYFTRPVAGPTLSNRQAATH
ncbi:MAG TPA: cytochrome C oxidase subunit IV family protein [Terriglobales bacterium]|nr:cytochrome C oxidase subunit IV family protein [Terriglobales bacterium]